MTERDELELEDLSTPVLELAAAYARAGMRVFPVDMRDRAKTPLHGYKWKERASSAVNEVVEDLLDAIERIGEANVGIGWALGLDRCLAIDLDIAKAPVWWTELLPDDAAVNVTHRGLHLIYRMPEGRQIGNGTAGFPETGWGEVRGAGGYVVVAGSDRPGFDVAQLSRIREFPRPDWLSDASAGEIPLELDELRAWLVKHSTTPTLPGRLEGFRTWLELHWTPAVSRHDTAVKVGCWITREISAGVVNARDGLEVLVSWWSSVAGRKARRPSERELPSIVRWCVAQALTDPDRLAAIAAEAGSWDLEARLVSERMSELVVGVEVELVEDPWQSFEPVDLAPWVAGTVALVRPDLLRRGDGRALLYGARLNGIHGDSGAGKSWLLAYAVRELHGDGCRSLVVDLEDTPAPLVGRLRQIGMSDGAILDAVRFVHPDASFAKGGAERLVDVVARERVAHVFLDSLGEAFALDGIDENADAEVAPWLVRVVRRLIDRTGAGITLIDHVTKAGENPLHPSGSKRKRAAITGASWYVYAVDPFSLELGGRIALRCGKDRHGHWRRGDTVAELVMGPLDVSNGRTRLELVEPTVEANEAPRDPLDVLIEALDVHGEHNAGALEALMERVAGWGQKYTHRQRELALQERRGLITMRKGEHGAKLYSAVRQFGKPGAEL